MKTALLVAVAIVILSSLPFVSRQTDAAAQENSPAHAGSAYVNRSSSTITQSHPEKLQADGGMQSTNSDWAGKLDTKSAKPGAADLVNINKKAERIAAPQAK
ncbi:MAG: hypothetical protein ABSE96_07930 [Terracidiphilus sp.]